MTAHAYLKGFQDGQRLLWWAVALFSMWAFTFGWCLKDAIG
jgi:hypothetical protein